MWVLSALVADRLREDNRALDALQRAVELARSEGIRRPFVTLAPEHVRRLLGHLQQVDPGADAFVRELVADLTPDDQPAIAAETLSENLTDRELSVLRYLPSMMTNEEIAAELLRLGQHREGAPQADLPQARRGQPPGGRPPGARPRDDPRLSGTPSG